MKIRIFALAFTMIFISLPAQAVIIEGKDWLQLSSLTGKSWRDFDSVFDSDTGECDVADCRLGDTDLSGYTWASNFDVDKMFSRFFGIDASSEETLRIYRSISINGADPFFDLFTPTEIGFGEETRRLLGWTRDTARHQVGWTMQLTAFHKASDFIRDVYAAGAFEDHHRRDSIGGWVYKSVPEPSIYLLLATGIAGLGFARRALPTRQAIEYN